MCGSFGGHCAHNDGSIPASTPEEAPFRSERSSLPILNDRELAHHRRNVWGGWLGISRSVNRGLHLGSYWFGRRSHGRDFLGLPRAMLSISSHS
jgi:hypothetical protein